MQTAILLPRHKLTVEHYHKMAEAEILTALDRVELIEGELIDMAPIGSKVARSRRDDFAVVGPRGQRADCRAFRAVKLRQGVLVASPTLKKSD